MQYKYIYIVNIIIKVQEPARRGWLKAKGLTQYD